MSHFKGKVDATWGAAYYQCIGATQEAGSEEQSETELHPVSKCCVTCQNPTMTNPLRESARPQADKPLRPQWDAQQQLSSGLFMAAPKEKRP